MLTLGGGERNGRRFIKRFEFELLLASTRKSDERAQPAISAPFRVDNFTEREREATQKEAREGARAYIMPDRGDIYRRGIFIIGQRERMIVN